MTWDRAYGLAFEHRMFIRGNVFLCHQNHRDLMDLLVAF